MIQRKNQRLNSSILIIFYSRTSVIREILHLTKCCRNEVLRILLSMEVSCSKLESFMLCVSIGDNAADRCPAMAGPHEGSNFKLQLFQRTLEETSVFKTIPYDGDGDAVRYEHHSRKSTPETFKNALFTSHPFAAAKVRTEAAAAVDDEFLYVHPDQQDEAAAAVVAVAAVAVAVASPHPQLVDRMAASR
ncbi:hypothetical protein Q3G72_029580 [Acer saccharum]|nr:hypothetical protein Q3G72_029580 [Acer saccharum]